MADLASTFTFKPLLYKRHKPISLNSLNPKLFGLSFTSAATISTPTSLVCSSISARYCGGGGGGKGFSHWSWSNDDQVLDISTIRSDKVRLIDEKQNMVGVVSKSRLFRWLKILDWTWHVILSPNAEPAVLRIINYDKYRYEQQKRKKKRQKKSAAGNMDLKELKMGYNIDIHDYSVRLKAAKKFLKDGDKVACNIHDKISQRESYRELKGRENEYKKNSAIELISRVQNDIGVVTRTKMLIRVIRLSYHLPRLATEESNSFRDRNIFILLVPNKAVIQKDQERSDEEKSTTSA